MKSFAAMLFGSLGIAAVFFAFVLLSNAQGVLSERDQKQPRNARIRTANMPLRDRGLSRSESHLLRAKPLHFMCPDRYGGGAVLPTKPNVVHLVCVRVSK